MKLLLPLENVYLIAAGKGPVDISNHSKVLHIGLVNNKEMPFFLRAADAFVLPTINEELSNAVIEALACGLPVISSDLPFNDDVLDESNSIRIDSLNINQIIEAIVKLRDQKKLTNQLVKGS